MKKWGLAAAGGVSRSILSRLPGLNLRLAPIGSTSFRLAVRIANSLNAGTPARSLAELDACSLILVCAPGGTMTRLKTALRGAALNWPGKLLVVVDSESYSCDLSEFRERGARVASVNLIQGYAGRYAIEGDRDALRHARVLVRDLQGKAMEVPGDRVRLYDASRTVAGSLFTPLIETCVECIRQAGITGPASAAMAEAMFQHSLRAFMHAGRKSWSGPIARADREAIDRECRALEEVRPLMARFFASSAEFGFDLFATYPELTRYNRSLWQKPDHK